MSPAAGSSEGAPVLAVRAGGLLCALPLSVVEETCRPLPLRPLAGTPLWVRGATVLRGRPTPVVDLSALLTGRPEPDPLGLVSVRAGERRVAVEVGEVLGVRRLDDAAAAEAPPLLAGAAPEVVAGLGRLDGELLVALGSALRLPDEVWRALDDGEVSP